MDGAAIVEFLAASIRIATPLLFGALGGLLSERAGTFAVGIEGMMLAGAFGGAVTTLLTADTGIGLAVSAGSGAAAGLVVAVATAKFRADHMVTGLALNILVVGLTSFLLRGLFGGQAPVIQLPTLKALPIPYLADLPGIGRVLFQQPALTYAALALTLAISVFLAKTRTGLMLRAVGENPEAAFYGRQQSGAGTHGGDRRRRRACWPRRRGAVVAGSGDIHRRNDQRPRLHRARRDHRRPLDAVSDAPRLPPIRRRRGARVARARLGFAGELLRHSDDALSRGARRACRHRPRRAVAGRDRHGIYA